MGDSRDSSRGKAFAASLVVVMIAMILCSAVVEAMTPLSFVASSLVVGSVVVLVGGLIVLQPVLKDRPRRTTRPRRKKTSSATQEMHEDRHDNVLVLPLPPPIYHEMLHGLWYYSYMAWLVALNLGLLVVLYLGHMPPVLWLTWPMSVAASVLLVMRRRRQWEMRPLHLDPSDCILMIHEAGLWWWLMSDSPPDLFPLKNTTVDTPRKTIPEQIFFRRSQTVVLKTTDGKTRTLRRVKDAERILAIVKWYASLDTQQLQVMRHLNMKLSD